MLSTLGYYVCVPFAWLVRLFYTLTSSYGLALIFFTLVIKLVMLPFQMKSKKGMIRMSRVSGRMQELQKQYKNNPQRYQMEVQKLYQEEGASPMSGCLWSFIPLPILLALYSIIRQPITHFMMLGEDVVLKAYNAVAATGMNMDQIGELVDGTLKLTPYGQIQLADAVNTVAPEFAQSIDGWFNINYNFLGLNLAAVPSNSFSSFSFQWGVIGLMLIPIVAGLCQFLMTKFMMKTQPSADPAADPDHQEHDVLHAFVLRVSGLHHARGSGPVLDRPECLLRCPGAGAGQVLHQEASGRRGRPGGPAAGAAPSAPGRGQKERRASASAGRPGAGFQEDRRQAGGEAGAQSQGKAQDQREWPHRRPSLRPGPDLQRGPLL